MTQGIIRVGLRATLFAVGIAATAMAQQNLLVNGSFELGPSPNHSNLTISSPSTAITGWTVTGGSIDYIEAPYWQAADGSRTLDLDGNSPGGIRQTVATVPNRPYLLSFALAGNPSGDIKRLRVSAAGQNSDFEFDTAGRTGSSMGWTHKVWIFIATGTSTTIDFTSLSLPGSSAGPALDDVGLFGGGIPAFLPIGQGCPGTAGTPLLSPNQLPRIGHPFSFIVYNLPLNQLGLAFLGFSSQSWGGYSLPLSMTPFGMDGCTLYTSVDIAQLVPDLGIFGTYIWGTQIPSDPGLLGVYFGMQFLVNDPGANSAGLILSNAGFGLIGA